MSFDTAPLALFFRNGFRCGNGAKVIYFLKYRIQANKMFDGLKFKCDSMDLRQLQTLPIEPEMCVGFTTGELRKITGECDGMKFEVSHSPENGKMFCRFRGSLQKYANGGAANVGAFTFEQVCRALNDLCTRFGIDLHTARLENVELGLELPLPIPARQFLKSLICHGSKAFQPINVEKPDLGKIVPRQEYDLKLYDKGSQAETGEANLLRVEIRVCKMMFLKSFGISTLADLTNPDKVRPLGGLLQSVLNDVICYDGSVSESALTIREQLHLKEVCNPVWWADLSKRSRWDYRQKFAAWVQKNGANKLFLSVVFSLPSHWENLLTVTHKTLDFLSDFSSVAHGVRLDFLSRTLRGQKVQLDKNIIFASNDQKNGPENQTETGPDTPAVKRSFFHPNFCQCCGRDISAQKPGSRFCSAGRFGARARRCRDQAHNTRRREARRIEVERLESLLPGLPAVVLSFTVFAPDHSAPGVPALQAVATLTHPQAYGQPFPGIRQAVRVDLLTTSGQCYTFTRSFAKRLIGFLASTAPAPQPSPASVARPLRPPVTTNQDKAPPPALPKGQRIGLSTLGEIADQIFDNLIKD